MDLSLRVLPAESYQNLPKEFTWIRRVLPPERSFYVSLGISLIQSLVRVKGTSLSNYYWQSLQTHFQEMQNYAQDYNNNALFQAYKDLINALEGVPDRYTASYWLIYYLSANPELIKAIEVGTKSLMCSCLNPKTWEFPLVWSSQPYDIVTKGFYLETLANYLRVHILVANEQKFQIFCSSDKNTAPLVTLYLENTNVYGILFHSEAYSLDYKYETGLDNISEALNTAKYPFIYNPRIDGFRVNAEPFAEENNTYLENRPKLHKIDFKEKIHPFVNDFFREISITLTNPAKKIPNKSNLLNIAEKLADKFPENENILNLYNTIKKIPDCSHETTLYATNCTQEHCLKCLYETIQSSKSRGSEILCPCNRKISLKCIDEIKEKFEEKPVFKKIPNPIEISTVIDKNSYHFETTFKKIEPKPPEPDAFPDRFRSVSVGGPQDISSAVKKFKVKFDEPQRTFNIKRSDSLNVQIPPEPKSAKHANKADISEPIKPTFNIKVEELIKEKVKTCENCKENKEEDEFNTVVCNGHDICSYCRAKSRKERECPICQRKYSDYELSFVNALVSSFQERNIPC